ncbi:MAG TPA: FKBP-type peptidyl-prolyl cis-trans isomerase [Candidatus Lokiarchaeia archaeon]|nr:FKBP-type peptidyl-prolyl cis-trans isomerase [Candidatus Lokiarchaeia archaeon]
MEQGNMRPWLPFVIAGGIVASEGGSLFSLGAMFNFEWSTLLQSFNSSSVADLYRMLVFLFLIIGLFSMPSGLILLGIGLNKKQKWKGPAKAVFTFIAAAFVVTAFLASPAIGNTALSLSTSISTPVITQSGDVVDLTYTGTFDNGTVFDQGTLPTVTIGNNQLLPYFDQNLVGRTAGQLFSFALSPSQGYQTPQLAQGKYQLYGETLHFQVTITKVLRNGMVIYPSN